MKHIEQEQDYSAFSLLVCARSGNGTIDRHRFLGEMSEDRLRTSISFLKAWYPNPDTTTTKGFVGQPTSITGLMGLVDDELTKAIHASERTIKKYQHMGRRKNDDVVFPDDELEIVEVFNADEVNEFMKGLDLEVTGEY